MLDNDLVMIEAMMTRRESRSISFDGQEIIKLPFYDTEFAKCCDALFASEEYRQYVMSWATVTIKKNQDDVEALANAAIEHVKRWIKLNRWIAGWWLTNVAPAVRKEFDWKPSKAGFQCRLVGEVKGDSP